MPPTHASAVGDIRTRYQKVSESSRLDCGAAGFREGIPAAHPSTSGEERYVRNALQAPPASRPDTRPGGRSRRRLLMRPAAYAILAAAVCVAAGTLPSRGRAATCQGGSRAGRQRLHRHPGRPGVHPQADQDRRAPLARDRGQSDPALRRTPIRSATRTTASAGRPERRTRSPTASPSYGLRTVDGSCNNLFPGRENVRGRRPAVPAPDDRRSSAHAEAHPAEFFGPGAAHPGLVSYAQKTGFVVRLAAARDQQPDRRPDVDQPGRGRRGRVPGAHAGQPGRRSRARPIPTRDPPVPTASRPAACRRTRRCSSRT